jgi:hypothetical protein
MSVPSFIQAARQAGAGSLNLTFGSNLTANSYILVFGLGAGGGPPVGTISDTAGNIYTLLNFSPLSSNIYLWGAPNTHGAVANTVMISFAPTPAFAVGLAMEYSGVYAASPVDVLGALLDATTSSYTGTSVITTRPNDKVVGIGYTADLFPYVAGAGQTVQSTTSSSIGIDQPAATVGAYAPSFTSASGESALYTVALASFAVGQLASDNFTRADADPIGSPWLPISANNSTHQLKIVANEAEANTADAVNISGDYYSGVVFPADQYSEAVIGTLVNINNYIGPGIRWSAANNTTGYLVLVGLGTNNAFLQKYIAGASTQLGPTFTGAPGDRIRLSAVGNVLTVTQNGIVVITVTDSAIATGFPAIASYSPNSLFNNATVASWSAGAQNAGASQANQVGAFLVGI